LHSDLQARKSKKPFVCIKNKEWWEEKLQDDKIKILWIGPQEPFDVIKFAERLKSGVF
jgi:hypothetical protein